MLASELHSKYIFTMNFNYCPLKFVLLLTSVFIILYKEVHTEEAQLNGSVTSCTNIDRSSGILCGNFSVDCAQFYDSENCTGNSVEIKKDLVCTQLWPFGTIRSIGPCEHEGRDNKSHHPHPCNTTIIDINSNTIVPLTVELFEHKDFKGPHTILAFTENCITLPRKLKNRVSSIRMHADICVELFENSNCSGSSLRVRKRKPTAINLADWGFDDKPASISLCGCHNFTRNKIHSACEHVTLYDEENLSGNSRSLTVTQCVDLNDEWEGATESLTIYKDCIVAYSHFGCNDESVNKYINDINLVSLILKRPQLERDFAKNMENNNKKWSIKKLSSSDYLGFSGMIRSIGPCPEDIPGKTPLTAIYMAVGMFSSGVILATLFNHCVGKRNRRESISVDSSQQSHLIPPPPQ